jgi:hypothetical protein
VSKSSTANSDSDGSTSKVTMFDQSLSADYDAAWKLIEYNMKINWQNLLALASLIGVMNLFYNLFKDKLPIWKLDWFIGSSALLLFFLCVLWFLFFETYTSLAHVYSLRRLEIEALCGMRTNWRGYLYNGELNRDIERWEKDRQTRSDKDEGICLEEVKSAIVDKTPDNTLLLKVIKRKYDDEERKPVHLKWLYESRGRRLAVFSVVGTIIWGVFLLILYLAN